MSFLTTLRTLVLGETWRLPIAVLCLLLGATVVRAAAPDLWEAIGGPLLLVGVVAVLAHVVRTG